ncbi:MAG: DUF6127 family protein [Desulfobacterales bacterium]|nr:DUF6127 family protein [Desulfobacterales bacterium]
MSQDPRASVTMTVAELEILVDKAAERSARKVLSEIGLFTSEEDSRAEALQDIMWVRRWRKAYDAAAGTIGRTVIAAAVIAIMGAMWIGAQMKLGAPPHP